jgi:uncharacterized membrane protein YhiD involved in acid resistance
MVTAIHQELFIGLDDPAHLGLIGLEREEEGKVAGLKTHMLVAIGAALFMLACIESGADIAGVTRVAQGLTTAIGFLGGGAILKLADRNKIRGLTTAANLWVAAATGMAVGMGLVWPAIVTVALVWFILIFVHHRFEPWLHTFTRRIGLGERTPDEKHESNQTD